jgi:hypothetical protein
MGVSVKKDKVLSDMLSRFSQASSDMADVLDQWDEDNDFVDGSNHWSDEEVAARIGRPCLVINKTVGAVKQIIGEGRKNRPKMRVLAVDSLSDPKVADLMGGLLRDIEQSSDAESAYDYGFESAVRGGIGYWRIFTDFSDSDPFNQEIRIERIVNPRCVRIDWRATRADFLDAQYCFIIDEVPIEVFKEQYPDASLTGFDSMTGDWLHEETVRVVEYFWKEYFDAAIFELMDGKIVEVENAKVIRMAEADAAAPDGTAVRTLFVGDGFEEPTEFRRTRKVRRNRIMWVKSNGVDILDGPTRWAGKYLPLIVCMGEELWKEGVRYSRSLVYHAKDAQKIYNWSRSNTVETLAQAPKQPYLLTPEEIDGHEREWNRAHVTPQAYRLFNDAGLGRPQPSAPSIPNTGAYREAMVSADDIKSTTGVFDASLGASGNETSGRAIGLRQQQSSTAAFVFIDNQAKAIRTTAKVIVDLIPKIYDTERVVRILNEEGKEAWQIINRLGPAGEVIANDMSVGRYDIVYDVGPSYLTRRQEAADGLMKVIQTAPQIMPAVLPDIAKNLDWPGADKLADKLAQAQQQQSAPSPDVQLKLQAAQQQMQLEQQRAQIEQQRAMTELEMRKMDFAIRETDYRARLIDLELKKLEVASKGLDVTGKSVDIKGKQLDHFSKSVNFVLGDTGNPKK